MDDNNLLTVLHKWARRHDENFFTDAFAHLVRHLCHFEPEQATRILAELTDNWLVVSSSEVSNVTIKTQVVTEGDRPDLEIRSHNRLLFVEVKMESELGENQLERYRSLLRRSGFDHTRLVLLTRYSPWIAENEEQPDVSCRWHQVADWLSRGLNNGTMHDSVSIHLTKQFVDFLKARNITMEKVGSELPQGLRSLRSLMMMIEDVVTARKLQYSRIAAWDYIGYYLDNKKFFLGVEYEWPEVIEYCTEGLAIRADAAESAGFGRVEETDYAPGLCWYHELDLSSTEVKFFDLLRAEQQMQRLQEFLDKCLAATDRIVARENEGKG